MRIGIIGKYPPIQGGVSMRTYLAARALAAAGHDIHVVTNAKEVQPPFRMHMRPQDWRRCEGRIGSGRVTVHWTDPVDRSQSHIPMASPFVSKLATLAAGVNAAKPFDVIYSHYMEPYGVAGHLAAQIAGVPHVVRMAGSDAGRLWHHPQFEALFDHVLRSAHIVIAAGAVAERANERGVDPARIVPGGGYVLPDDQFAPTGPALDIATLRAEIADEGELRDLMWGESPAGWPHFGVYGKLGDNKGSFALLDALHRLKRDGLAVGLVALAHGRPEIERRFRARVLELGLGDRVQQLPFLPHWRVPEFLRSCLAVCCLEQDFPIGFHSPITPLETLLCGACLVASTEVIRKLPQWQRLPHGYGCVAVPDVDDVDDLSRRLAAIVREPAPAALLGARGRAFARECQDGIDFPQRLERILEAAAERRLPDGALGPARPTETDRFPLTRIAAGELAHLRVRGMAPRQHTSKPTPAFAKQILAGLEAAMADGMANLRPLAQAVEVEIAIASAEADRGDDGDADADPLFRLPASGWAFDERTRSAMRPMRDPRLRVLRFDHDVAALRGIAGIADFPKALPPGPSYVAVFGGTTDREPLLIDRQTARILELSDGSRTAGEIAHRLAEVSGDTPVPDLLAWIENLLLSGLIRIKPAEQRPVETALQP